MKIFYAMPFTGKTYEQIVNERKRLNNLAKSFNLQLLEQFIAIEEKKKFESHAYGPLFIAQKDFNLISQADLIIADYNQASIGRDYEIAVAKEEYDKRCIAVVSDNYMQNHPWIRLYNDYIVSTPQEAFSLAQKLSSWPLASEVSKLTRSQKDEIDLKINQVIKNDTSLHLLIRLLPTELKYRWQNLFGFEYENVLKFSFKLLPRIIRINTLKINKREIFKIAKKYSWILKSLKFSPIAYEALSKSNNFETIPEYERGYFYIQQLSSMLSAIALNPKPGEKILEIGAAPGSKTTQIAQLMKNKGEILANDVSSERLAILKKAIKRLGIKTVKTYLGDGSVLGEEYPEQFDRVLVDAPCSNEGIIRYKPHKFFEWNLLLIHHLTGIQQNLLESGFKVLKPAGTLVYSTCSFGPEENEAIVDSLLKKYPSADIKPIKFKNVKTRAGLRKWDNYEFDTRLKDSVRIYPQDNDSVGFFIAKIIKRSH